MSQIEVIPEPAGATSPLARGLVGTGLTFTCLGVILLSAGSVLRELHAEEGPSLLLLTYLSCGAVFAILLSYTSPFFLHLHFWCWRLWPGLRKHALSPEEFERRATLAFEDLAIAETAGVKFRDLGRDTSGKSIVLSLTEGLASYRIQILVFDRRTRQRIYADRGSPLCQLLEARILDGLPSGAFFQSSLPGSGPRTASKAYEIPQARQWSHHRRITAQAYLARAGFPDLTRKKCRRINLVSSERTAMRFSGA